MSLLESFAPCMRGILSQALESAGKRGEVIVGIKTIMAYMLREAKVGAIVKGATSSMQLRRALVMFPDPIEIEGIPIKETDEDTKITFSDESKELIRAATENAKNGEVRSEHLLMAAVDNPVVGSSMKDLGITRERITSPLKRPVRKTSGFDAKYCVDLVSLAEEGSLDPCIGREKEMERILLILSKRTKNNPVIVGSPGVGKTAIVEGLAQLIASGNVPENFKHSRIYMLNLGSLVAGTQYRGEFEQRLQDVLQTVREGGKSILFIDELHTVLRTGSSEGAIGAGELLKPELLRGEIKCIGTTTPDGMRMIDSDPAFERRFQTIWISEPTVEETFNILCQLSSRYEEYHKVVISEDMMRRISSLSERYISDRNMPDKAIDVMDESAARAAKRKAKEVELSDVAQVISTWTGIPVESLTTDEAEKLSKTEQHLSSRVIGQVEAVTAVARALRRSRSGMKDKGRPSSFLFAGPTGVGKTELAKALAEFMFGSQDSMVRLDMSEYMEPHSIARLIGSPPGYVGYDKGGQLADALRRTSYVVILVDEMEKAHPTVLDIFLQLMEDGRLTDGRGKVVNAKDAIIIMTSNIGTADIVRESAKVGFRPQEEKSVSMLSNIASRSVTDALSKALRPELLGRFDDVIVFNFLSSEDYNNITRLFLDEIGTRVPAEFSYDNKVVDWFVRKLDAKMGARPLRRMIAKHIVDPLADEIVSRGNLVGSVVCSIKDDAPAFVFKDAGILEDKDEQKVDRSPDGKDCRHIYKGIPNV